MDDVPSAEADGAEPAGPSRWGRRYSGHLAAASAFDLPKLIAHHWRRRLRSASSAVSPSASRSTYIQRVGSLRTRCTLVHRCSLCVARCGASARGV
jgi:hypothetical protein